MYSCKHPMFRCLISLGVISKLTFCLIYGDDQSHQYTNQFVVWCDDEGNDTIDPEWTLPEHFTIEKLNISGQDCLYLVTDLSKPKGIRSIEPDTDTKETLRAQLKVKKVEQQEYKVRVKKTSDTQWSNLWYLNGALAPSMKIQEAWNLGYNGSGITIAVVDDGVEITHTDLDANMYSGYHYDYIDNDANPDPSDGSESWRLRCRTVLIWWDSLPLLNKDYVECVNACTFESYCSHGTMCRCLIVAEANNNECVVGVAYRAKVIGVRLLSSSGATDLQESQSISHRSSIVDIYSNSWGPTDGYGYSDTGSLVKAALLNGVSSGRSGKGNIFTWAAGNGEKDDNCNGDGYVKSIYTIGVTSLDSTGIPAFYSEVCVAAMATTYGGTSTSRYLYSTAYSRGCANDLQGTSFANPVAAGIIALSLQANPNLNWRDVQHLIVLTSKKYSLHDSYYSWLLNGANKYVHPRLGFGLMDAEDMVKYASTWIQVPSQVSFQSSTSSPNSYVGPSGVSNSITIGSECSIQYLEHVQVQIYFQADTVGYAEITLNSPSGTNSFLMTQRYQDNGNGYSGTWTFMTVHNWGEVPQGQWTLKMAVLANSGRLYSWKLILYGTQTDPLPSKSDGSNGNNESSTTAAIAGGVVAGVVVLAIAVGIGIKLKLDSGASVAPVTTQNVSVTNVSETRNIPPTSVSLTG